MCVAHDSALRAFVLTGMPFASACSSQNVEDAQPRGDSDNELSAAGRTDAWKERGFATLDEWRAHTQTDLYRVNAKRRVAGQPLLTGAVLLRLFFFPTSYKT